MSEHERLGAIKAWWAAFDAGGWQDASTEPLVQARAHIDWLIARVEELEDQVADWQTYLYWRAQRDHQTEEP